jgi:hypothetical protein
MSMLLLGRYFQVATSRSVARFPAQMHLKCTPAQDTLPVLLYSNRLPPPEIARTLNPNAQLLYRFTSQNWTRFPVQ